MLQTYPHTYIYSIHVFLREHNDSSFHIQSLIVCMISSIRSDQLSTIMGIEWIIIWNQHQWDIVFKCSSKYLRVLCFCVSWSRIMPIDKVSLEYAPDHDILLHLMPWWNLSYKVAVIFSTPFVKLTRC